MRFKLNCTIRAILLLKLVTFTFILVLPLFVLSPEAQSQDNQIQKEEIARLDSADGIVEVQANGATEFKPVAVGTIFYSRDTVRTAKNSRAAILFSSGTILRLAPGTSLQFQGPEFSKSKTGKLNMAVGQAYFFDREPSEFPVIDTPAVTTAVRGTEFVITVSANSTEVSVLNGSVECLNSLGSALATDNELVTTKLGEAPIKGILVNPADAVQWTLYYPALIDLTGSVGAPGLRDLEEAQNLLSRGQVNEANEKLLAASKTAESIDSAQNKKQLNSLILAQRSVIATVRDQKQEALYLANQSWELDNNLNSALAVSYALQSDARLDEAREWLARAYALNPSNPYLLARQAEMELGFGNIEEAAMKSQQALEISPTDSYALSVSGFVSLIKDDRQAAIDAFETAIKLNPASGLPHLGLGLILIRKGELSKGRKQLEQAVALEPRTAIYRSYLGKAFYEEDREALSVKEYNHAIELDEKDPTPYLYRAFSHLSSNETVFALRDVERSIELNNNRAVYRSSLLLDQDLGARSAGLAAVFNELGFAQAGRVEAIKSINHDYSNYSAHRLLADSYNTIFLNDAGISENQISTLLAPLSFNLISQGSANSSFNEYNSLFDRDESQIEVSGEYQSEDSILQPEITASGKKEKFGYLIGFDGLYTDESGVDNYSKRQRGRAALQYQPNFKDLFLVDSSALYRKALNDQSAPDEVHFDDYEVALGYRHYFGPESTLILQSSFAEQRNHSVSRFSEREISLTTEFEDEISEFDDLLLIDDSSREVIRSLRNSAQLIYETSPASFVFGTQVYDANADRNEESPVIDDKEGIFQGLDYSLESSGFNPLTSLDLYSYSTWHLAPWVDLSAGASFSQLELEEREITPFVENTYAKSHLSPKAGLTFYPSDALTLRSAYFETLRKSSLEDQSSLEPTLVGGINQRFTDLSGSTARTFGLGADYKAAAETYLGVEGIKRHLVDDLRPGISSINLDYNTATAINDVILLDSAQIHQDQNILRAYLNQVISDRWVGTLNYEWSKFERTDPEIPQDIDLDRASLALRYMDPTGWYALSELSYRHQSRDGSDFSEDGSNGFWLVDTALGYRIPERKGAIELKLNNIFDKNFQYDQSQGLEDFVRSDFNAILAFTVRY